MGAIDFWGSITIDPPLNDYETAYLKRFTARCGDTWSKGPYFLGDQDDRPGADTEEVLGDHAVPADVDTAAVEAAAADPPRLSPAQNTPGSRSDWVLSEDRAGLELDVVDRYDDPVAWAKYLIDVFLRPGAVLQHDLAHRVLGWEYPAELESFSFDHVCSGVLDAQGENGDDRWRLVVRDNVLSIQDGEVSFARETLLDPPRRTGGATDPALAGTPVARLLLVRSSGGAMAWASPSPVTFDGIFRGVYAQHTLEDLLGNPDLVIPPGTPIVRLDLAPIYPALLFELHGPHPCPDLPDGTVRRLYRDSETFLGALGQLLKLTEASTDLYLTFAAQCGVTIQRTG